MLLAVRSPSLHMAAMAAAAQCKKHIKVKYFYTRELVAEGRLVGGKVATNRNLADLGTKQLQGPLFRKMSAIIYGHVDIPEIHGCVPGMKVEPLTPFVINSPDQTPDPSLKYMLDANRHPEARQALPQLNELAKTIFRSRRPIWLFYDRGSE